MSSKLLPSEADFWLDTEQFNDYIVDNPLDISKKSVSFNLNLIRLASVRKAISNFVRILTRQSIPVYFNNVDVNRATYGKIVHISAKINTKSDFDVSVGQALHEGAHILLTDFDIIKDMWANIPSSLFNLSDNKGIRRASFEKFLHSIWNIVEDRYIDNYVFNRAPGYRGYYVALYNRFWHDIRIDDLLLSDEYRWPSLESYLFRICHLTNINTDFNALPRLDEIADIIDLSNINRLQKTKDRVAIAFKISEIVLDCVDTEPVGRSSQKQQTMITPDDFFESSETDENTDENRQNNNSEDAGTKIIKEISDIISGKDKTPEKMKENENAVTKISDNDSEEMKDLHKELSEKQHKFLTGNLPKESVNDEQKDLLNLIDTHGIVLVQVGEGLLPGNDKNLKVDCIVVQKMTKELILKGQDVFPLSTVMKMGDEDPNPPLETLNAVTKGISLGTKLGRKLQIRREIHMVKSLRKRSGKINKRQLHEAAFDAEDLFYKVKIETHRQATLHITVDASGSMSGEKWIKTLTAVVAICKAASMIDNIHVTVSFRSTQTSKAKALPYVIMAYNSKIDKFSKVKNLFPYLEPNGLTPEGLAFEAIMNLFEDITPDEEDRYFLNLSDGEPCYYLTVPQSEIKISYVDDVGVSHTKSQVMKIRRKGVEILSYFIEDIPESKSKFLTRPLTTKFANLQQTYTSKLRKDFQKMYGKNAKFINVGNIVDLAKTMNELFLNKVRESS